ncbi:MAG: hypothetical protein RM368_36570 [Nostoc sp. DedSLP03]|uniref:hypothetical protein n=1 Tax=Nostoc sp. DedSLP03 TaxID=3075400 RepID=UPI002AD35837|nr:hypothetical protein [Nostoc sp. DedSLP03]MDZ7970385.1 hypothetical protein [Nostoc sp. DedSLP03]
MDAIAINFSQLTLSNCIEIIRDLPDQVMTHRHGILVNFGIGQLTPEEKIFQIARSQFRAISLWLEYLVLGRDDKLHEAMLLPSRQYKPLAEDIEAILKLIQQVKVYCYAWGVSTPSVNVWWLNCCAELCDVSLSKSGYTNNPQLIGKVDNYKQIVQECRELLDEISDTVISNKPSQHWVRMENVSSKLAEFTPLGALESLAKGISINDSKFRHDYYVPYLSTIRRGSRQLKESLLKPAFLIDGNYRILGVGLGTGKRSKKPKLRN